MGRKTWLIIASAGTVFMVIIVAVLAYVFRDSWGQPRTMSGPLFIADGKAKAPKHGFLGIEFVSGTMPLTIQKVLSGSGAAEAGLRGGDVIRSVGMLQNPDYAAIQGLVEETKAGEALLIKVARGPDVIELRIRLISFSELRQLRQKEEDDGKVR